MSGIAVCPSMHWVWVKCIGGVEKPDASVTVVTVISHSPSWGSAAKTENGPARIRIAATTAVADRRWCIKISPPLWARETLRHEGPAVGTSVARFEPPDNRLLKECPGDAGGQRRSWGQVF